MYVKIRYTIFGAEYASQIAYYDLFLSLSNVCLSLSVH